MTSKSSTNSLLSDLVDFINDTGQVVTQSKMTIDLRDLIEDAKAEGEKLTRKQALASLRELEEAGIMKINKKIDKNRFLVEMIVPSSNENLLPGFEPSKF